MLKLSRFIGQSSTNCTTICANVHVKIIEKMCLLSVQSIVGKRSGSFACILQTIDISILLLRISLLKLSQSITLYTQWAGKKRHSVHVSGLKLLLSFSAVFLIRLRTRERNSGLKNHTAREIVYPCRQRDVTFLLATSVNSPGRVHDTSVAMHMH